MRNSHLYQPEISILMPYRNESRYLRECIKSILDQSSQNWELIGINDHSTDNSLDIIEEYVRDDERIRSFKNEGIGIIDALNTGYKYSMGKYITRMDADDLMMPDKLSHMVKVCNDKGPGYIAVGMVEYFSGEQLGDGFLSYAEWLNNHTRAETNFQEIYLECPIPSPCWMMHRDDLDLCGAFEPDEYPEDYDLSFRVKNAGIKVTGIDKVLHRWRDHEDRSSRNSPHYMDNRFAGMKVRHFLKQDFNQGLSLVLWGAGKKGKAIARELLSSKTGFTWITNNSRKTGLSIYDTKIESPQILKTMPPGQVIIAFSTFHNPKTFSEMVATYPQHQFFRFF